MDVVKYREFNYPNDETDYRTASPLLTLCSSVLSPLMQDACKVASCNPDLQYNVEHNTDSCGTEAEPETVALFLHFCLIVVHGTGV